MITITRNKDNLFSLKSWYLNQKTLKLDWAYSVNNKTLDEIVEFADGRGNSSVGEDLKLIFTTPIMNGHLLNRAVINDNGTVSAHVQL